MLMIENMQIAEGFLPVDLQTGANDGDWVSMKDFRKLAVLFFGAVGTAGDDPTITIEQATDNAGAGAKALDFTTLWVKQAATDLLSTGQFTRKTQAASNTFTDTDAAEEALIWWIEFDSDTLDVDNAFDFVRARVADIGANAQLGCILYFLGEPRYPTALPASVL